MDKLNGKYWTIDGGFKRMKKNKIIIIISIIIILTTLYIIFIDGINIAYNQAENTVNGIIIYFTDILGGGYWIEF